jgi:putative transposase
LCRYFAACRFVYNVVLEVKIYAYRSHGATISEYDLVKQLQEAKKEFVWLQEFSAQTLNYEIACLDLAYKAFFKKNAGFPKYKNKYTKQSCTFLQNSYIADLEHIQLPKVGQIQAVIHRKLSGPVKRITVSKTASGKYYASVLQEIDDIRYRFLPNGEAIGIDMGIRNLVTVCDGKNGNNVTLPGLITNGASEGVKKKLEGLQAKIKRVQRYLSRKTEHRKRDHAERSKRQEKCRLRLARLKEQEASIRKDFLDNISCAITNNYLTICIEDLAVKNMTKSAAGTIEKPGKNVKAKAGLNREIQKSGFGMLRTMLEYKGSEKGREIVVINRFYSSSKNCNKCGYKNEKLGSKVNWKCPNCGTELHRDQNAAKNILVKGLMKSLAGSCENSESEVLADNSRGAERKGRKKYSAGRVGVETITTKKSPIKKSRKPMSVTIAQQCGVDGG